MSTVPAPPREVQAFYSVITGMLIREDGKPRPATLDEVEQAFGQTALDDIMSMPGHWHDLIPAIAIPMFRCRCWTYRRNCDRATVILPGVGKVERLLVDIGVELFNKIAEAEAMAWQLSTHDANRGKGYVELTGAEIEAFKTARVPMLRPITRPVRRIDLSQFTPPTKPAA